MARHPQWIIDTEQRTHPAISIDLKFRHLAEKLAFLQHRTLIDKWTTCRLERSRWRGGHCLGVQLSAVEAAVG